MSLKFNHVSVTCGDLDRSLAFYNGLLGLSVLDRGERTSEVLDAIIGLGPVRLRFAELAMGDGAFLELFEYVEPRGVPVASRTCDHGNVHFAVEVQDIDETHRRLCQAGVVTRSAPVLITSGDWTGARAFYSLDPDGVTVECIEFPPRRARERILILQHEPSASAGSFGDWAAAHGYAVDVLLAGDEWGAPDLSSVALLATLGSESASYDDRVPWLARELEVLEQAHRIGVPVLGICFGSQILARSLGARTRLADRPEIGWYEIESSNPSAIPPGPWLFWHEDRFDLPLGAELLARTAAGPAVYRAGSCMGVQFHPEVTEELFAAWIDESGDRLGAEALEALGRGVAAERDRLHRRAFRLYDTVLANALRTQSTGSAPSGGEEHV